jgi:hypothetical protein
MTYTDEELCDVLRTFTDAHGRPPTAREANVSEDCPHSQTFVYRFGSWNGALEAAGLDIHKRRRSDAELLAELREFADEQGECPSATAVTAREDMATAETYRDRFGSWSAAVDAAGVPTFSAPDANDGEDEEN